MSKKALIRYKTIDRCLCDRSRAWTLADLMTACAQALAETGDTRKTAISRRSVQMDLELMRDENKGYHAPIVVVDKKFYTYADPHFSITQIPLTQHDCHEIHQIADLLAHFEGYAHFEEATLWIKQLRNKANGIENAALPNPSPATTAQNQQGETTLVEYYVDAPFVDDFLKKPVHPSQKVVSVRIDQRHLFSIEVVIDAQLEQHLLGFGEYLEIMSPKPLRLKLGTRIWKAGRHYWTHHFYYSLPA